MRDIHMIAIRIIFGQHLPVGVKAMLQPARTEIDFTVRRHIAGAVKQFTRLSQIGVKRRAFGSQAGER